MWLTFMGQVTHFSEVWQKKSQVSEGLRPFIPLSETYYYFIYAALVTTSLEKMICSMRPLCCPSIFLGRGWIR